MSYKIYVNPGIEEQKSLQYLCQVFRGTRYWVGFGNKFCYRWHVDKTFPDEVQSSQEGTLNFNSSRHLWAKKKKMTLRNFQPKDLLMINVYSTCSSIISTLAYQEGQSRTSLVVQLLGIHLPKQETHI